MACAFAMIMAGADNADLSVLTEVRSEPAVPFAGKFRLIDFSLSNCVNSGIHNVAVLTQYRPRSLNDHIGIGKPWDLDRSSGGVRLFAAPTGADPTVIGNAAPPTPFGETWTTYSSKKRSAY